MSCVSEIQVKRTCMASMYTLLLGVIAGGLFGFAIAIMANLQFEDRITLGITILTMSGCVCAALGFGLYIFNIPQPSDDTF
jgi:hypothetical protein